MKQLAKVETIVSRMEEGDEGDNIFRQGEEK